MVDNKKFMAEAIELAKQAKAEGNSPFGAVIVKDNGVIARGRSLEFAEQDVTKHAELMAVSEACRTLGRVDLSECVLYASGEPCIMCAAAAFQANISRVVIGATRDDLPHFFRKREIGIFQLAEDSSYKPEIKTGVLREEAIKLFEGARR